MCVYLLHLIDFLTYVFSLLFVFVLEIRLLTVGHLARTFVGFSMGFSLEFSLGFLGSRFHFCVFINL